MSISVVILAAGKGTRMKSDLPKVLHEVAGLPMLQHIINAAEGLQPEQIVVVHGEQQAQLACSVRANVPLLWAHQAEQLGTGHAVMQALPVLTPVDHVLVLTGDIPLITTETLQTCVSQTAKDNLGLITAIPPVSKGLGRIVREQDGSVAAIVEERDASNEEKAIKEINTGIMLLPHMPLSDWLSKLDTQNNQAEYYLTDMVAIAKGEGYLTQPLCLDEYTQGLGVNDRSELARAERLYQRRLANDLMCSGVTLSDPARLDIRGELTVGVESQIDINVIFEGKNTLGKNCTIGPNVLIKNCTLGDGVTVLANTVLEHATIGDRCTLGPFARVRPDTHLHENVKVGNFVEIKKTEVAEGAKINHLSYIGDAKVGANVNVGAGTITCNYDGVSKHQTTLEAGVFIGSNTSLVAPVTIGAGATVGAGSVVTKDVPEDTLAVTRAAQKNISGWERPSKK